MFLKQYNVMQKKNKSVQNTMSAFFIPKYINYIKALSRMPELQANGFIQTKIHCKGGRRIKMSTFDGNFHEFLQRKLRALPIKTSVLMFDHLKCLNFSKKI